MKVYTKKGDAGTTGLFGGSRIAKDDLRVECYGTIDEANSMMGLARANCPDKKTRDWLERIQHRMFVVGAELASDEKGVDMLKEKIGDEDVAYLEGIIDECMEIVGPMKGFVLPGENPCSGALHCARTIARRAERRITTLTSGGTPVRDVLKKYINRLSDAMYAMARYQEEAAALIEAAKQKVVKELSALNDKKFPALTLATARRMAEFAEEKANEMNLPVVFSAVDKAGNLILVNRMADSLLASIDISMNKAYTAAALKLPTHTVGELTQPGAMLWGLDSAAGSRMVAFGGGFPYEVDGEVVGGIGVSGGTVEQDMTIASYALSRVSARR